MIMYLISTTFVNNIIQVLLLIFFSLMSGLNIYWTGGEDRTEHVLRLLLYEL